MSRRSAVVVAVVVDAREGEGGSRRARDADRRVDHTASRPRREAQTLKKISRRRDARKARDGGDATRDALDARRD